MSRWHSIRTALGLRIAQSEGANSAQGHQRLKTRGAKDILIAVVDALKGLPDGIASVYRRPWFCRSARAADPQEPGVCRL